MKKQDNLVESQKEKVESISDSEWLVAKILWERSPQTSAEIIDELKQSTVWSPKTIHTLIRRLAQKKIIAAVEGVTPYRYYPLLSEAECEREKTRSFVERIYNGSFNSMVSRFVKEKMLSKAEIEELKDILNGK